MRDIAREVGVSHVTVSLALRDHARISEAMRERIRGVAERMGYRPDPVLAALASYRKTRSDAAITASLAWINGWPEPDRLRTYKEFDYYWQGAELAAHKFGYRLEEFRIGGTCTPKRLHQILSTRGVSGILLPPHTVTPDWGDFPWAEYPVIRFGRSVHEPRTHLVTADHVENTVMAFHRIRERGYRRIGFVTDEADLKVRGHLFESGYLTAQRFVPDEDRLPLFLLNDFTGVAQKKALGAWFRKQKPDAIITNVATVPELLESLGIRVPEDVGLAATTTLDLPITAGIDQQPLEIGRVAVLMLNSLIHDGARGIPGIFRQNLVEGTWVDGDTLPDRR